MYGIKGKELVWFESYLFNRKQLVFYAGIKSEVQTIVCGVPQGSILGPLLFTMLINDIEFQLQKCDIILYADDIVIFMANKIVDEIENELNRNLDQLAAWFINNNLIVSMKKSKTECIVFGSCQKLSTASVKSRCLNVKLNGVNVIETNTYDYLGVKLDKNLNFAEHLGKIYKKASSRVKLLARVRHNIGPTTAQIIYKTMILPVLLYCNNIVIAAPRTYKIPIENIQSRAIKIINNQTNITRLPSVNHNRNKRCAIEVFKCLNGLAHRRFNGYFTKLSHSKETRGNNLNLVLPKVRTEAGRKTFAFQGTLIYNKLPTDLKEE